MRILIIIIILFFPSINVNAQMSGGQIKRNKSFINSKSVQESSKITHKVPAVHGKKRIIQNLINNMVYVKGGEFYMGATPEQESDYFEDEKPSHEVTLSHFYIGKYEVTQEEWLAIMGYNPSEFIGMKRPVENVSWEDCQLFIKKLNTITGKHFRLPTEAEWEYAARGGIFHGYKYSGSDFIDDVAWYSNNRTFDNGTSIVGAKSPNNLGLYDMSGNVGEWCNDWYEPYKMDRQNNYKGPLTGSFKVFRGGNWGSSAKSCRVSCRSTAIVTEANIFLGFRLAL